MDINSQPDDTHRVLKTKLDELRVRLHLGGMEAHDKYQELMRDVTAFGRKATQASKDAARRLRERIEALEASLVVRD